MALFAVPPPETVSLPLELMVVLFAVPPDITYISFKAPSDIAAICKKLGFNRIEMPYIRHYKNKILDKAETVIKFTFFWIKLLMTFPKDSVLIYQHPTLGKRLAPKFLTKLCNKKDRKVVCLIHDLESLRGGVAGLMSVSENYESQEFTLLGKMDYIICHNDKMKEVLVKKGIDENKLVSLQIFDYLTDCPKTRTSAARILSVLQEIWHPVRPVISMTSLLIRISAISRLIFTVITSKTRATKI